MSTDRRTISTTDAPAAIGPYVQAVATGQLLFVSGQIPLDPATGEVVGTTAAEQAEQVLKNLTAVVSAAGASMADVVRCGVFVTDMGTFAAVNEVYARHFPTDPPARATIAVAGLPLGVLVEIDAIVVLPAA